MSTQQLIIEQEDKALIHSFLVNEENEQKAIDYLVGKYHCTYEVATKFLRSFFWRVYVCKNCRNQNSSICYICKKGSHYGAKE